MSRLISHTSITVDGLCDVGDWFVAEGEHDAAGVADLAASAAFVTGRKCYDGFLGYWPSATGPWAEVLNPMPKYVASRTLSGDLAWNARVIEGDAIDGHPPAQGRAGRRPVPLRLRRARVRSAGGGPRRRGDPVGPPLDRRAGNPAVRGGAGGPGAARRDRVRLRRGPPALPTRALTQAASCWSFWRASRVSATWIARRSRLLPVVIL